MRSFMRFVNGLPLAGKIPTRGLASKLYGSTTIEGRIANYSFLTALLFLLVLGHLHQARTAIQMLDRDVPLCVVVIGIAYITANVLAVIAECHLWFRATSYLRSRLPRTKRNIAPLTAAECGVAVLATLAGQFLFLSQWILYR
ncbi:MAG TPA: hypothetical protein VMQ44_00435 [Candidatus Saccharimonadales bacterium]|nr:hypothetical protein [Candidatus Saccharimonadales bacterium]